VKVPSYQLPDFGYVAIPQFMMGNLMSIAWCKRPGCPAKYAAVGAIWGPSEYGSLNITE
jgi:hypothetical protein